MNRHHKIVKTSSSLSTGKALLNHILFSPSQTGETVPLKWCSILCDKVIERKTCNNIENVIKVLADGPTLIFIGQSQHKLTTKNGTD
jgi:hypothetical protein